MIPAETGPPGTESERRLSRPFLARAGDAIANAPHALLAAVALAVYGLMTLAILRRDFLEYNADGYTRIIRGHEWLDAPRWEVGVWLPLHTWLYGAALAIHHNLSATPRVVNALLTAASLVFIYLIGAGIAGKVAGAVGALVAALFPWVVWMGASGMSEPLFHATLFGGVAAFVRWLDDPRDRWLLLAALGVELSTMTRYEGWFYAAALGPLALWLTWRRGLLSWRALASLSLLAVFPLIWMQQHWQRNGDPFAFARETAAIKEALEPENATAGLLRRLAVYPEEAARLAPWLALLCALAVAYALYRRVRWWPLIALIAGQAVVLVGVSAAFSNLGPGAERYLLSNFILAFPVLAATATIVPRPALRALTLIVVLAAPLRMLPTLLDPPTIYPDASARELARVAGGLLDRQPLPDESAPALFSDPSQDSYNASYALRILSGHPDAWLVLTDPATFAQWVEDTRPPLWVMDAELGVEPPPGSTLRAGRFLIGGPLAATQGAR